MFFKLISDVFFKDILYALCWTQYQYHTSLNSHSTGRKENDFKKREDNIKECEVLKIAFTFRCFTDFFIIWGVFCFGSSWQQEKRQQEQQWQQEKRQEQQWQQQEFVNSV